MTRGGRIALVTAGLFVAGAICGAVAGALALGTWLMLLGEGVNGSDLVFAAVVGAPLGGLVAPLFAWTLMRRVPIGRMLVVCTVSTAAGGIIGALPGAFLGCLCAAVALYGFSLKPKRLPR